jgi:hypothetical protein
LEASDTASQGQTQSHTQGSAKTEVQLARLQVVETSVCALALAVSISLWFIAIRAPLWLDETHSFFVIKAGFAKIYSRMGWPIVPVYPYILWFGSKVLGTSEIALRIPSIVAMLGAVYLLYRAARELFDRDAALIAAVVFCLHPIVISAAIDVRPYAFAAFTINASILALVRLRNDRSDWLAALFGVLAAGIGHFQFIFTIILPALAVCFIYAKIDDRRALWRQGSIALAAFTLFFLPVIPVLEVMFKTSGTHVFDDAPDLSELGWTLAPAWLLYIFLATILLAIATRQLDLRRRLDRWSLLLCASLALVPILILFGVSVETSIHVFVARYRLVAIPGIALCWAWLINRVNSPAIRSLFCVAMVASIAYPLLTSPEAKVLADLEHELRLPSASSSAGIADGQHERHLRISGRARRPDSDSVAGRAADRIDRAADHRARQRPHLEPAGAAASVLPGRRDSELGGADPDAARSALWMAAGFCGFWMRPSTSAWSRSARSWRTCCRRSQRTRGFAMQSLLLDWEP